MAVYTWVLGLLTQILTTSPLPVWAQDLLLQGIKMAFTPATVDAVESQIKALVCSELTKLQKTSPGGVITAEIFQAICTALGCPDAAPANSLSPA